MKFATKAIHAGIEPDPLSGAVMTPIYQTSTYVQEAPGKHKGYEYARTRNPTRDALQNNLAALENGQFGIAFASGLAAMDAVLKLLEPGDHVVSTNDLYGGSYRLMTSVFERYGIKMEFVDLSDVSNLEKAINSHTKLVWLETPTNPLLRLIDIEAAVKIAHGNDALVCVDNTFASPYLQQPLDMGADIVLHSATKYLGGHSDAILGALVVKDQQLAERFYYLQNAVGAVPGPHDCFLILRGIKTLHVRMDYACRNAAQIARYLNTHNKVHKVHYPGLEEHPSHALAKRQMSDFGAMVSFELVDDSIEQAHTMMSNTDLFSLAESLGGVESLIGHPASMTHGSIPRDKRIAAGLQDGLIRLSVGIEDVEDLIADLDKALAVV